MKRIIIVSAVLVVVALVLKWYVIAIIIAVIAGLKIVSKNIDRRTLHRIYTGLRAIGLDAQKVERGRPEEHIGEDWKGKSQGLIEIQGSPIRWVNVLKEETSGTGPNNPGSVDYHKVYLIPHPSMGLQKLELKSVRVKSVPVVGRVVDLKWKGNFEGNKISQFSQDISLSQTLIRLKEDIEVHSHPDHGCWSLLSSRSSTGIFPWVLFARPAPSRIQWDCYETIARYLLESSGK